jgi:hypothetical protein
MATRFGTSADGTCIAYDVTGSGPALMLLHGAGKTRRDWHKVGYVERLKGFEGEVPHSYCYCSVGWVKEMFEQALGRPIEVEVEASVLRGDEACRLRVSL